MKALRCLVIFGLGIVSAGFASGAENEYGVLPSGARSVSEVSDVAAEIARDLLFDPASVAGQLPPGYRLVTAEEYAQQDPGVAGWLKSHPGYARYGVGSLVFMSVGKFIVDGVRVHPAGVTPMAFWWARVAGPRDPRMQGKVEWVQLASWYSRDLTDRARILATDPTAQFVDLSVAEVAPHHWRLRMGLDREEISADVTSRGEPVKRRASAEHFMSVPMGAAGNGYFWVITYYGHHHQPAEGEWRSHGTGIFASAFQIPEEASVLGTGFQSRWSALSGLYICNP